MSPVPTPFQFTLQCFVARPLECVWLSLILAAPIGTMSSLFNSGFWIACIPFILCLLREGYRWQQTPGFIAFALCSSLFPNHFLLLLLSLLLSFISIGLCFCMPVPLLPRPGGPFQVGCVRVRWNHQIRTNEVYGNAILFHDLNIKQQSCRDVCSELWYPCQQGSSLSTSLSPVWGSTITEARVLSVATLALFDGLKAISSFAFQHITVAKSNSHRHAPPLAPSILERFPVVIFSHGYTGHRFTNVCLCEELASRGFLVMSVQHSHCAAATLSAEGTIQEFLANWNTKGIDDSKLRLIRRDQLYVRKDDIFEGMEELKAIDSGSLDFRSRSEAKDMTRKGVAEQQKTIELLTGRLDLSCVALVGHSFGGATAVTAGMNTRNGQSLYPHRPLSVSCVVGLDVWTWPLEERFTDESSSVQLPPTLFVSAVPFQKVTGGFHRIPELQKHCVGNKSFSLQIEGGVHSEFTDAGYLSPLLAQWIGLVKSKNPLRTVHATITTVVDFVQRYHSSACSITEDWAQEGTSFLLEGRSTTWPEIRRFIGPMNE